MILPIVLLGSLQTPAAASGYPVDADCQQHRDGGTLAMSERLTTQPAVGPASRSGIPRRAGRAEIPPIDLRAAQQAWRRYRDANCLAYDSVQGPIATILAARCRHDMTRDRALELNRMTWNG